MRILAILPLCLVSMLAGCPSSSSSAPAAPAAPPAPIQNGKAMSLVTKGTPSIANGFFFMIRMRMATVEVPVGTASGSEEIWSYLDEEPVSAFSQGALGRNGFRVGRGRADSRQRPSCRR